MLLSEKKLVPKLRFSGFEDEWKTLKIGDCLDVKYGKDYKHLNEGKYPVLGTGGVMEYVDDFLYSGESILIGRKGTIDKPRYINGSFWTVDTLFYTEIKKEFPKFLFYCLSNINWLKYNEASGVPSLSANNIKNVKINVPKLDEQKKIANLLTLLDNKINLLKEKHEDYLNFKKYLMQQIFAQKSRFKDDGSYYGDWNELHLKDIISLQGGFAFKSELFKDEGIPIIRISNISPNNSVILDDLVYYDKLDNDSDFIIKKGELIIAMSGATTGKVAVYDLDQISYINQRVGLFKQISNELYYPFLVQYTLSDSFKRELQKTLVAGAQPNISKKEIESFGISLPPYREQKKIADLLNNVDLKIKTIQKQNYEVSEFKKYLLQQMFDIMLNIHLFKLHIL